MKNRKETVIHGVLTEELERNDRMRSRYIEEIESLPKGSIVIRKIGKQEYYYLTYRENRKVVSKYLGKKEEVDIEQLKKDISKRKHFQEVIKDLKQEEKEIKKALR